MHVEKIRSANLPAFQLEPKNAILIVAVIGVLAYVVGFLVGLGY